MSEKKYIDVDLLKEKLKECVIQNPGTAEEFVNIGTISALSLVNRIAKADVKENIIGEWIHEDDYGTCRCSECGCHGERYGTPFCPNCGACMENED